MELSMRPKVFIGSSTEGLPIANAVQQNLDYAADCTVWTQGVFGPSSYPVDALVNAVRSNDFGIFVFSDDDAVQIRNKNVVAVRDNVILESGLFIGRYGKDRNFIIAPRNVPDFHIPTDLLGITLTTYDPARVPGGAQAAVGAACTAILNAIMTHPVMTTQLTFSPSVDRGGTHFPLKLRLEIRNTTGQSVLITSQYFEFSKGLRPHANAKGNPAKNQFEVKFAPPGGANLNQFTVIIHPNQAVSTWIPLDPSHTDAEVQGAIASQACGKWHYTCDWLGPTGWHRAHVQQI
jgi:hypothetical protein